MKGWNPRAEGKGDKKNSRESAEKVDKKSGKNKEGGQYGIGGGGRMKEREKRYTENRKERSKK